MDCLRQERWEAALVPAQEHLFLTRQRVAHDRAAEVDLSQSLIMLAGVLMELKRYTEAERLAAEAVELARQPHGDSSQRDGLLRSGLAIMAACGLDDSVIREVTRTNDDST